MAHLQVPFDPLRAFALTDRADADNGCIKKEPMYLAFLEGPLVYSSRKRVGGSLFLYLKLLLQKI